MITKRSRNEMRLIRHRRLRRKISGTPERPRLAVFRSLNHIYAQMIDDTVGHTLVSASTLDKELRDKLASTKDTEAAKAVGELIAKRALEKGIKEAVFDRGGHKFHGRVKALAEAARNAGLKI
ncbi:LSU ribosomal protein L18P [Thermovirga lienii DSM 17291]|uniref:Large ribosomal subunit protein uL18 n=2 Tax=Thermovirga TaxID=336260 RepID=G7V8V6_THELD|nr:LSU ribosomal protein L18P [Thermovirga lienii DSM 17291]KUK42495.1 MAG: 50S ribosomal protein L18 [Thermovirga lienii]HCD72467.1 50S ribosomal protein L18 [Thermovirga lienii]